MTTPQELRTATSRHALIGAALAATLLAGCMLDMTPTQSEPAAAPTPSPSPSPSPAPVAPSITGDLADQTVAEGSSISFTVGAAGTGPLAYQWLAGSSVVSGATGPTLALGPAALSQNGTQVGVTVSNGVGSATSRLATLSVTPRAWSASPLVPAVGSEPAGQRRVGVADAQGNVTFAFQGPGGTAQRPAIWTGRIAAGSTTPVVADISSIGMPAGHTAQAQRIAVDASGRTMVVWEGYDPLTGGSRVYAALAAWGQGDDLESVPISGPSMLARNPDVAAVADGVFEVIWREAPSGGAPHDIVARRFTAAGSTWAAQQPLENGSSDVDAPRIASDGAGRLWAVWSQFGTSTSQVVGLERTPSQSAWNPAAVAVLDGSTSPGFLYAPQILLDGSGHGVLAYHDLAGLVFVRRLVAGSWTAPVNAANWAANTEPAIALHPGSGRISIASFAGGTGSGRIYHWSYDPANGWSAPFAARTAGTGLELRTPQIGFDNAGNALLLWEESTGESGNGSVLRSRRLLAGTLGWQADAPLLSDDYLPGESNPNPALVVAPDGSAAVMWTKLTFGGSSATATPRLSLLR